MNNLKFLLLAFIFSCTYPRTDDLKPAPVTTTKKTTSNRSGNSSSGRHSVLSAHGMFVVGLIGAVQSNRPYQGQH